MKPQANNTSSSQSASYDASAIEVLEGLEPVRKRPGMYVGGTDSSAMHHLVSEVVDNAMDEAVAGFATRIDITFHDDHSLTVQDNGRGIPVDPHPKFPERSALEVILCTLHAGGKFSGKSYQTAGGLHGVGISVVNALSDSMIVEVVRDKRRYTQSYSRGEPLTTLETSNKLANRKGTRIRFHPDPVIFGNKTKLNPMRVFQMIKAKAYLFSGVEIRWNTSVAFPDLPETARFHFPGGLRDFLQESIGEDEVFSKNPFTGKVEFSERFGLETLGFVEWAINWTPTRDGFMRSYCNTVPTSEGGTHETGFWNAILKGLRVYGEYTTNRRATTITREDIQSECCALISCYISDPEFVGQTKNRLATKRAQRLVENSVRDRFDNWLAADPKSAGTILNHLVSRAEERIRRRAEKETARKSATRKLRLPGKLVDCTLSTSDGTELFIVEGASAGGSAKMARDRNYQALLPLRGKVLNVLAASSAKLNSNKEISDLFLALGISSNNESDIEKLRYEKIIIMTDADVDGAHIASLLMTFFYIHLRPLVEHGHLYLACPPLYRISQGSRKYYAMSDKEMEKITNNGLGGKGRIEVARFKGLGEMDAKDLKSTTMNPKTRKLIKVIIDDSKPNETDKLISRLMGRSPEDRMQFIQERAQFATCIDL